ncbi:unnamed protein product [Rotaria sordida]|uniref:Reverse transcriptase domain-containing protein n=1 Tax=Rotaria sordida TaxID=392033 RepID=A0A815QC49_9BILA|nr:unnamed protein product [Rotaria sordida]
MSTITLNNPNNLTPQPPQQQQGFHQCHACGCGVLGGNQSDNYGGNQSGNYGGNQSGNYGGNQSSNYGGNQSGNYGNYRNNARPNYQSSRSNYPNHFNSQNRNGNYRSRSRSPYYNSGRRSYQKTYYNRNYRPQRQQQYNNRRGNYRGNFRNNYQRQYHQPHPITMGDFLPQQLQNGQNIPSHTTNDISANVLPQRPQFANNNTTQPFVVQQDNQNNQIQPQGQQQRTNTTSSHRRRERRRQQQQYRKNKIINNNNNNNRFAILAEEQQFTDDEEENINYDNQINKTNKKNKKNKTKIRSYLNHNRILNYFKNNENIPKKFSDLLQDNRACDGVENFLINSAPVYGEQIRAEYELQVWRNYLKLGKEYKHWAKEVVQRTKKRDDNINIRFVDKKSNQLSSTIHQTRATISRLEIEFGDYWTQIAQRKNYVKNVNTTVQTSTDFNTTTSTSTRIPRLAFDIDQFGKLISNYIEDCLKHVKKMCDRRILLAKAQMEEYKALEEFEKISTAPHKIIHLVLKPKMKIWSIKNKNFHMTQKRLQSNLLPKFITKNDLSFKIDESILKQDDIQIIYNDMQQIKNEFYRKSMELYSSVAASEFDIIKNEIEKIIEENRPDTLFITRNDDNVNLNDAQQQSQDYNKEEKSYAAFEHYHQLRIKRLNLEAEQSSTTTRRYCPDSFIIGPNIINEATQMKLTEEEYQLLNLRPRFIFNDLKTAAQRRTTELATLRRKIETRFFEKKVSPGRPVQQFIAELYTLLQNLHNSSSSITTNCRQITSQNTSITIPNDLIISSQPQMNIRLIKKKKNYHRLIKRLKYKFRLTNTIIRKTDKSKVFHLGKLENYEKGSKEYMNKTNAYVCLGTDDPLPDLVQRANQYLLNLRLAKWITQKQYEQLCIKVDEVEIAHLYYLPKAHKAGTPLRPIISDLKHSTIKIFKFLDDLLRPLFDKMASNTTVTSGFELVKKLQEWSQFNIKKETVLCTIDVADLYTMIPQVEGVLTLKKMLDFLQIKQIKDLKVEAIIRLTRFVMQNNYFKYNGQYYHQIRGGAMESPLTLTVANCYMFFYERDIVRQISNSGGLYLRYIDDLFIIINWPVRHFMKQIDRWNKFDENIKLSANINSYADFLDVHIENRDGQLFTTVYYKPSYEPYSLY